MYKALLVSIFAVALFSANAQRGFRGSYGRGSGNNYARVYNGGGRVFAPSIGRGYGYSYGPEYRTSSVYRPYNYGSAFYGSHYYGSGYYGPNYYGIPHGSISINFGGYPYYYSGGLFYRPFGGYYRTVFPPVGLHIGILPYGYMPVYVGPDLFYFYNGTYYRQYDDRNYEVVDAPMGAQVSSLPRGAKSVSVNGEKFYELNGTYYKEDRNSKGRTAYTVVGKNGQIDNTDNSPVPQQQALPRIGDKVGQLPDNCKTVTINGQKLYVSPDNTYYQADPDGNFSIVGLLNTSNL